MSSFKGFKRVTQGEPLSPNIFNLVVGAVVSHWVEDMVEISGGQDRWGQEVRHQKYLFYMDGGGA